MRQGRLLRGNFALPLVLLGACADRSAPLVAEDPARQCWNTDRLLVDMGGQRYLTPSLDRSRGSILATARNLDDVLDLPMNFRAQHDRALPTCQRRARVPLAVTRLSFQLRPDALFPGSPAFNRIELMNVRPHPTDAPITAVMNTGGVAPLAVKRQGPMGEQPYRFEGAQDLTVYCAPRLGDNHALPRRWSDCSAFVAINGATRLWIQFDADGRPPNTFPRIVAASRDLIVSLRH